MAAQNSPLSDPSAPAQAKPIWKNLGVRFWSAIIFSAICLVPFYFGGLAWAAFVALLAARLTWEWVRMSDPAPTALAFAIPIVGIIVAVILAAFMDYNYAVLSLVIAALIAAVERVKRKGILWAALGYIYVAVPTLMIVWLRGSETGFGALGLKQLFFIILVVVAADTGAYFGGSLMKGPKIAPKLSPNKTWSGFMTGLVFGIFIGVVSGHVMGLSWGLAAALAVPIVICSVVGDFLESGLKRRLNVKDAGDLLPGHGGLLDRLDGLMLAVVAAGLILIAYPHIWTTVS